MRAAAQTSAAPPAERAATERASAMAGFGGNARPASDAPTTNASASAAKCSFRSKSWTTRGAVPGAPFLHAWAARIGIRKSAVRARDRAATAAAQPQILAARARLRRRTDEVAESRERRRPGGTDVSRNARVDAGRARERA